jgi:hypothetical protein
MSLFLAEYLFTDCTSTKVERALNAWASGTAVTPPSFSERYSPACRAYLQSIKQIQAEGWDAILEGARRYAKLTGKSSKVFEDDGESMDPRAMIMESDSD